MTTVHFSITLIFSLMSFGLYKYSHLLKNTKVSAKNILIVVLAFGLILRYYLSIGTGFDVDINLFRFWSESADDLGIFGMYGGDFFLDYPPGYMYFLYIINNVADLFGIETSTNLYISMMKVPAIAADVLSSIVIFNIAKKYLDEYKSCVVAIFYYMAPAVIYNSAVWGQIDSYYTLLVIMAVYFAMQDDVKTTALIYGVALATKPQALLFGPVFLYYMIEKRDFKKLMTAFLYGGAAFYILTLPISKGYNLVAIFDFYMNTFGGYKYMTVNTFNIYYLLDLNWALTSEVLFGDIINIVFIPAICLFTAYHFFTKEGKEKYLESANLIIILFFFFCTMMHERYMYPALFITILLLAITNKVKYLYLYLLMQAFNYLNIAHVYDIYATDIYFTKIITHSAIIILIALTIGVLSLVNYKNFNKIKPKYYLVVLIAFISIITFHKLGNDKAPQTYFQSSEWGEQTNIVFDEVKQVSEIYYFTGMGDEYSGEETPKISSNFTIYYSDTNNEWQELTTTNNSSVFAWQKAEFAPVITSALALVSNENNQTLSELVILDSDKKIINGTLNYTKAENNEYPFENLFDEAGDYLDSEGNFVVDNSYYYSSYFDEIYFARTAYELNEDYSIYETTHPHLGKLIISIGISLFGMNPFGFRFMGALFSILIVVAVYFLAKELFKSEKAGLIAAALSSFDLMRVTQGRIATSDSFLIFFMILTFYFMLKYKNVKDFYDIKTSFKYLLLSGVFMALTISVKWNGAYPMIGLAIFFFYTLYKKYKDSLKEKSKKNGDKNIQVVKKTIAFCFLAFVFIPAIIYFVLFLPVLEGGNLIELVKDFIRWQVNMFNYHSQLVSEHFFASPWYTWFFVNKPIWFSVSRSGELVNSVSSFGNIAIWWAMPFAAIYLIYKIIKNKDDNAIFIVISYVMCIVPWMAITRLTFIYHYYPATIFGILAITYILYKLFESEKYKKFVYIYIAVALIVFIVFLPVATGFSAPIEYADSLELFENWYFN